MEEKLTPREIKNIIKIILAVLLYGWGASTLVGDYHFWLMVLATILIFFVEKKKYKNY